MDIFLTILGLVLAGIVIFFGSKLYRGTIKSIGLEESVDDIETHNNETSLDKIKKTTEKRIKIAENKGIDKLVCDLYFNVVKYCSGWLKNKRNYKNINTIVSSAKLGTIRKKHEHNKDFSEIVINNKKFRFIYQETFPYYADLYNDNKTTTKYGLLELFYQNKKVFAVNISIVYDNGPHSSGFGSEYVENVEAFLDGDWINDLRDLKLASEEDSKENSAKRKAISEKEEAKKLKKNFGI